MKKNILLLSLLMLFIAVGCTDWSGTLDDMQQKLDKLKTEASGMNTQAEAVASIVEYLQQKAAATGIDPVMNGNEIVGYTLTFDTKNKVTVYNQPSNVSFVKKDGNYYWTFNGEILKDASGNEVEILSQSAVPQFKVEGAAIKYSLDGGSQWISAGEDLIPAQPVSLVTEDEDNVYINMTSGEKIAIAKVVDLKVTLQGNGALIGPGQTKEVTFSVEGVVDSLSVSTLEHDGWIVKVKKTGLSTGVISVTAPIDIEEADVIALFSDGRGRAVVEELGFVADDAPAEIIWPEPYEKDFPILAWYSLTPEYATKARFKDLADAGFTISLTQYLVWDVDAYKKIQTDLLEAADGTGVKIMVEMQNWTTYTPYYGDDTHTVATFLEGIKDHPALFGYQILDEPTALWFGNVAEIKRQIKAVDSVHHTYVNLLPDWEQAGFNSYQEYVAAAYQQCGGMDFFSFDKYAVHSTFIDPLWYMNLEVIRTAALTTGRTFWAFALSCGLGDSLYPVPSVATIRLQQYVNLAYGAQGIEYFTYQDANLEGTVDSNAPIDSRGNKTPTYDVVKQVNQEIQNRSYVFKGSNVKWIRHTLAESYCTTLSKQDYPECLEYIKTSGGAVVSYLENDGKEYLMIVNRSHLKTIDLKIEFNKNVYTVERDGSQHLLKDTDSYHLFTIDKGDTMIFRIK